MHIYVDAPTCTSDKFGLSSQKAAGKSKSLQNTHVLWPGSPTNMKDSGHSLRALRQPVELAWGWKVSTGQSLHSVASVSVVNVPGGHIRQVTVWCKCANVNSEKVGR
jgi:hypothetical protein